MRQVSPDGMLRVNERCEPGESEGERVNEKQSTYTCMHWEARTEGGNHLRYNAAFATVHPKGMRECRSLRDRRTVSVKVYIMAGVLPVTNQHMYRRVRSPARKERCYYGIQN